MITVLNSLISKGTYTIGLNDFGNGILNFVLTKIFACIIWCSTGSTIRNWYKVKTWLDQIFWQIYQKLMLSGFLTQESWVVSLITFIRSLATVQSDCSSQFSNFKHTIAWYHFKKRSPFFALFKKKVFTCIFWTCKWHDTVVTLSAGDDKRPAEA